MSFTPVDSEPSPASQVMMQEGHTFNSTPGDEPAARGEDGVEHEALATEKLACDRCRYRKIKCDRVHPCTHCIKVNSQCSYTLGQKLKEKRQRVLISSIYESRMEHISRKIDDLTEMVSRLTHAQFSGAEHVSPCGLRPSARHWPSSTPSQAPRADPEPDKQWRHQSMTGREKIESSLFSQAVFATKFLQAVVANDPRSQVASEMTSAIDALRSVVEAQKRRNDAYEGSNPFEKPLPSGLGTRDLPLPPLDKVMACLRMAQGHSRVHVQWLLEFRSLGHFTEYVVKAYSPGPITDAQLIIIHMGLYWLFSECSSILTDDTTKHDYDTQALICRDNLEIVLSTLPFHTPTTLDYVHAMHIAALYCLQTSKPVAAWAFISKASLLAQALGLHGSISTTTESFEESQRKIFLFWSLYCVEKAISLRLGRSSTIRDHDITVPRPNAEHTTLLWYWRVSNAVEIASLCGRLFDNIYGPQALEQTVSIRAAYARELSTELKRIMTASAEFFKYHSQETLGQAMEPKLLDFFKHADRFSSYSLLTSIYKSMPSGESSSCSECVSAARVTLQEHVTCLALVADEALQCPLIDFWVNGALLLLPFIPLNIIFCNIIEISEASDLQHLLQVVDALESTSRIPRYSATCDKKLRIFSALYNVAAKYVEIKAKTRQNHVVGGDINWLDIETYLSTNVAGPDSFTASTFAVLTPASIEAREQALGNPEQVPMHLNDQIPDNFGVEGVLSGTELGDWFYRSHQMMRFSEESLR